MLDRIRCKSIISDAEFGKPIYLQLAIVEWSEHTVASTEIIKMSNKLQNLTSNSTYRCKAQLKEFLFDVYNDKYFVTFFPSLYLTCPSITGLSSPIFLGENIHRYVEFSVILNSDSPEMSFKTFHWAFNFADKSRFHAETEHFAFFLLFPSLFTRREDHWRAGDLCYHGAQSPSSDNS